MTNISLPERITAYRREKNLTARALAKTVKVHYTTILQIENRSQGYSGEMARRIENFMAYATEEQLVRFRVDRRGKRRYSKNTLWDVPTIEEIDEEFSR